MTDTVTPTVEPWLRVERTDLAIERILTAAGEAFASHGIDGSSIAEVAKQAGCSRGTIYRFFGTRDALRSAFIEFRGAQIAAKTAALVADISDPAEMIVSAMSAGIGLVRADPVLLSWFQADSAAATASMAARSDVIKSFTVQFMLRVAEFAGDSEAIRQMDGADFSSMVEWVHRLFLSLLLFPAAPDDPDGGTAAEQRLLRRFLVPVLLG